MKRMNYTRSFCINKQKVFSNILMSTFVMFAGFFSCTAISAAEVFPGTRLEYPYEVLGDGRPLIAMSVICYKYETNTLLSQVADRTNPVYLASPERFVGEDLNGNGSNDVLFVYRLDADNESVLFAGAVEDSVTNTELNVFYLVRTNATYVSMLQDLSSNPNLDTPLALASSAHPLDPYSSVSSYPSVNVQGMTELYSNSSGGTTSGVNLYVSLQSNTWLLLSEALGEREELAKLVSYAMTANVTNFVGVYSTNLYPELLEDEFTNNMQYFEAVMDQFQHPERIRVLTSIVGSNEVIHYLVGGAFSMDAPDAGSVSVLRFVREGGEFYLTPRLTPPTLDIYATQHVANVAYERMETADSIIGSKWMRQGIIDYVRRSPPLVGFLADNQSVWETGVGYTIPLRLSWSGTSTQAVRLVVSGGSAVRGSDYDLVDGWVPLAPGQITADFPLSLHPHIEDEGDKTIELQLAEATSGIRLGNATNLTVHLLSVSTNPIVAFARTQSAMLVTTNDNQCDLLVTLSTPWTSTVAVACGVVGGTAVNGIDYVLQGSNLQFSAGSTTSSIPLVIRGGSTNDMPRYVELGLYNPENSRLDKSATYTLTLIRE